MAGGAVQFPPEWPGIGQAPIELRTLLRHHRRQPPSTWAVHRRMVLAEQVADLMVEEHAPVRAEVARPLRAAAPPPVGVEGDNRPVLTTELPPDVIRPAQPVDLGPLRQHDPVRRIVPKHEHEPRRLPPPGIRQGLLDEVSKARRSRVRRTGLNPEFDPHRLLRPRGWRAGWRGRGRSTRGRSGPRESGRRGSGRGRSGRGRSCRGRSGRGRTRCLAPRRQVPLNRRRRTRHGEQQYPPDPISLPRPHSSMLPPPAPRQGQPGEPVPSSSHAALFLSTTCGAEGPHGPPNTTGRAEEPWRITSRPPGPDLFQRLNRRCGPRRCRTGRGPAPFAGRCSVPIVPIRPRTGTWRRPCGAAR